MNKIFWTKKHGTYCSQGKLYLIDLMLLHINNNKLIPYQLNMSILMPQLNDVGYGGISPMQVINDRTVSIDDYDRMVFSDLRYPIILDTNLRVVDGSHRLGWSYMLNKKFIDVHIFDKTLMEKFVIEEKKVKRRWIERDWDYYNSLTMKDIEELYKKRF